MISARDNKIKEYLSKQQRHHHEYNGANELAAVFYRQTRTDKVAQTGTRHAGDRNGKDDVAAHGIAYQRTDV